MNVELISIGSELMAGRIADTNAAYISGQLTCLGLEVTRHTAIGDRRKDILAALAGASERADTIIITGGIGPTPDDITRQTVAEFCGVPLITNTEALKNLHAFFALLGRTPSESNAIQADIPRGAELIPNPSGTASGFAVRHHNSTIFVLPGVPREMKSLLKNSVIPKLSAHGAKSVIIRCLQVYGLGESVIGERLHDLMGENRNPEVATQAKEGIITVRVTAQGTNETETRQHLAPTLDAIRQRLGETIFDEDERPLNHVVARLLEQTGATLALAESCTGGELAARLTDVPGISRFFLESAVTYSNQAKIRRLGVPANLIEQHGAVSRETAAAMAAGMRKHSDADIALAITGIAGPSGGSEAKPVGLVYIALADSAGTSTEEIRFPGNRQQVRNRTVNAALNRLRLYLTGQLNHHAK